MHYLAQVEGASVWRVSDAPSQYHRIPHVHADSTLPERVAVERFDEFVVSWWRQQRCHHPTSDWHEEGGMLPRATVSSTSSACDSG